MEKYYKVPEHTLIEMIGDIFLCEAICRSTDEALINFHPQLEELFKNALVASGIEYDKRKYIEYDDVAKAIIGDYFEEIE